MTFFRKLFGNISIITLFPGNLFSWLRKKYDSFKNEFFSFLHHIKILRTANIALGKYHLKRGNFKDANLRFWITNKLFAPNDPENLYWHGWANIFVKDFRGAIEKLNNNSYDEIGLCNYISNMSTVWTIPEKIDSEYNFITEDIKLERYFNDQTDLFTSLQTVLMPYLPRHNWDNNLGKFTVLEIDTHPLAMEDLCEYFPKAHQIDAINFSQAQIKKTEDYNAKNKIYRQIILNKKSEIVTNISTKYDLIIAFDSLSYTANLKDNFKAIKKLLTDEGLFVFTIPKGALTKLEPENNHFIYTHKYLTDQLKLAEFESSSITAIKISKDFEYFMVIVK